MKKIRIIETAFRDAHQSLLATRMRTKTCYPLPRKWIKWDSFHWKYGEEPLSIHVSVILMRIHGNAG